MRTLTTYYQKYKTLIEKYIFPILLFLYPLMKILQGIDVSDSTYSLGNYLYFNRMEGMWVISTYLSNVLGAALVKLPGGHTLAGMNLYTGLIVSVMVLICYYTLKKQWHPAIVFLGEIIAVGLCWIPTGILYNYMTYLFFTIAILFLYRGLIKEKNGYLFVAGVFLGANVMVRFPNLTQASLILVVWYVCFLHKEKIWKKTGICLIGYVVGFGIPFLTVLIRYGFSAYIDMITSLMSIQNTDETYSAFSMIGAVISAYGRSMKWLFIILIAITLGIAMFYIQKGKWLFVKKIIYVAGMALMLRFFWGRGMFSFRYYEDYSSMFEWGMLLLFLALATSIYALFSHHVEEKEKLLAVCMLIILAITPLGSNNYTCQNLNNLFLVAPFTIAMVRIWFKQIKAPADFPIKSMLMVILFMITIQSIGFHSVFVFRDGMRGEKRDTIMSGSRTVNGMRTNKENAEELTDLISYCDKNKLIGQEALFYGDAPGLSFILQMPPAISTSWPDLDSYPVESFTNELTNKNVAYIILRDKEPSTKNADRKQHILEQFIKNHNYQIVHQNEAYTVLQQEP